MKSRRQWMKWGLGAAAAAMAMGGAMAQDFPNRPVRITTPFPVGAGPDVQLRMVADKLSRLWKQPVVVENKPGASGFIAFESVKRAAPDGYNLLHMDNAHIAAQPFLFKRLPYDMERDFRPIAMLFQNYFFVAVPGNSPYKSVADLLADAKKNAGSFTYGSWFVGSPGHLGGAMMESVSGIPMMHVPYKEMGQLYAAVATGEIGWAFGSAGSAGPLQKSGKLRFLASASPHRDPAYPDVPTVTEAGGPKDFELAAWAALVAPRNLPAGIFDKIHRDVQTVMKDPDLREKMAGMSYEPVAYTPEELQARIEAEKKKLGAIIKRANITLD